MSAITTYYHDGVTKVDHATDEMLETARRWTLHLPTEGHEEIQQWLERLRTNDPFTNEVYEVCGGDSWQQWAEESESDDDVALHISFMADDEDAAVRRAQGILDLFDIRIPGVVSTAGDWAEQHFSLVRGRKAS